MLLEASGARRRQTGADGLSWVTFSSLEGRPSGPLRGSADGHVRATFGWDDDGAADVDMEDYH